VIGPPILTAFVLCLGIAEAEAQSARAQVAGVPRCETCRIVLRPMVTLGDAGDPELLGDDAVPVRDSRGRFYTFNAARDRLLAFDSAGRQQAAFGRTGQGPGELVNRGGVLFVGPADSLHVFQTGRHSVFAPSRDFIRMAPMPGAPFGVAVNQSGEVAYSSGSVDSAGRLVPVRIVSGNGTPKAAIGTSPAPPTRCALCRVRVIGQATGGAFWIAPRDQYSLERWSSSGLREARIEVAQSPWFRPWSAAADSGRGSTVTTRASITQTCENNGVLWVRANAPNSGEEGKTRPRPTTLRDRGSTTDTARRLPFATVIEAIDVASRTLLASVRFDGRNIGLIPCGYTFERRVLLDGVVVVDVSRLEIIRK
jgi:hypothetical protein